VTMRPPPPQVLPEISPEANNTDYHIHYESGHLEWPSKVLKQGDTFSVLNPYGNIITQERPEEGIFHQDTRFLSHYELRVNSSAPLLLSSSIARDNTTLNVHLSDPSGSGSEAHNNIHIARSIYLWQGTQQERLKIKNYGAEAKSLLVQYVYDSDFADIFEVRGQRPHRRGKRLKTKTDTSSVTMQYRGRDQCLRTTRITFDPAPQTVSPNSCTYLITIKSRETICLYISVLCDGDGAALPVHSFASGLRASRRRLRAKRQTAARIYTSNELFNEWLNRSLADLYMLTTKTQHGLYPYAGIPWFSTPFGRDGIITALQSLWMDPSIARGVLRYLANNQATTLAPESDAAPGKILHETRMGEMANIGEVPFKQYYGSGDSTPLFIFLAGEYFARTGDHDLIQKIWPNIERALGWLDEYGDIDNDGFVEYCGETDKGLANQGWKDSADSIFHRDGTLAQGPVALCEVQAYVYAARQSAAQLARVLGRENQADKLDKQAQQLKGRFNEAFWNDDIGTYVLALDGSNRQCVVRSSNAGHTLLTGIASPDRAILVAKQLSSAAFFSGWGIRTIATTEARYNPMSYHNGSIWPHDNALIAMGLARYGIREPVATLTQGLFEAANFMDLHRMPELFCGFSRRAKTSPIHYPNACAPQAWACSTVVALLNAMLGISFDAKARQIHVHRPMLPPFLEEVQLRGLHLGDGSLDLTFRRVGDDVAVVTDARERGVGLVITS